MSSPVQSTCERWPKRAVVVALMNSLKVSPTNLHFKIPWPCFVCLIAATFRRGAAAAEDDRVDPHELNLFAHSYFYSKSIIIYHHQPTHEHQSFFCFNRWTFRKLFRNLNLIWTDRKGASSITVYLRAMIDQLKNHQKKKMTTSYH